MVDASELHWDVAECEALGDSQEQGGLVWVSEDVGDGLGVVLRTSGVSWGSEEAHRKEVQEGASADSSIGGGRGGGARILSLREV